MPIPPVVHASVQPGTPNFVQIQAQFPDTAVLRFSVWRVLASHPGRGDWFLLRRAEGPAQAGYAWEDLEAPFGEDVSYAIETTFTDGSFVWVESERIQLTGVTGCWLTDVMSGASVRITLKAWPERSRKARRSILEVAGRSDPVVLSDVHTWSAGQWTIWTDGSDLETVLTVLLSSGLVRFRSQPGSFIAPVWASVGDVTEQRRSGRGGDGRRAIVVDVQEIQAVPDSAKPSRYTLGGLNAAFPGTLQVLSTKASSLLALGQLPATGQRGQQ